MPTEKYKEFRNLMFNELGITKDDIRQWTKEAAFEAAERQARAVDVEGIVSKQLSMKVKSVIEPSYGNPSRQVKELIKESVADILSDRLTIAVR